MARTDLWTREQTIVAFYYYNNMPFGLFYQSNPRIIEIANLIGRKPSALVFKIGNFASLDPEMKRRGVGGLPNTSNLDKEIWKEFNSNWDRLTIESAELIANFKKQPLEVAIDIDLNNLPKGEDRIREVKTRIRQSAFRTSVLIGYDNSCCITGIAAPELLVASHIKPWSVDEGNRTNPQNGLCLNALHDKAFDRGLITVLPDHTIKVSKHLDEIESKDAIEKYFRAYDGRPIIKPGRYLPKTEFLEYHNEMVFRK